MGKILSEVKLMEGFSGQRSIVLPKILLDMAASDALLAALHITAMGYYPNAGNHFRRRDIPIDDYVLIYCASGEGWFMTDGETREVKMNSYFILPAGIPHSYGASAVNPWTIYWVHFRGALAPLYAADCVIPRTIKPSSDSRIRNRLDLFEEIFSTLDHGFNLEGVRYAVSLFHHFLGTLRFLREYRNAIDRKSDLDIVDMTIHYMEENIEHSLTLSGLSAYSGYSASYLSAIFKERTGHAPIAYFNLLKIRYACRLLKETNMRINSICHKVGVRDSYYFSRLFSKVMGMSPQAYRSRSDIGI